MNVLCLLEGGLVILPSGLWLTKMPFRLRPIENCHLDCDCGLEKCHLDCGFGTYYYSVYLYILHFLTRLCK